MSKKEKNSVVLEGVTARRVGRLKKDNPYKENTEENGWWELGWMKQNSYFAKQVLES